jgi:RNA polymerase sigma-70 factor (ECF subfamily)
MTPTDDALLEQARSGDRAALALLLKRHGPAARAAVAGRIPQRWSALLSEDDVMQQTYADAALSLGRFADRGEGSFGAWLAALARANLLDALKHLEARKRGGGMHRVALPRSDEDRCLTLLGLLGASTTTPSRAAAAREAQAAVRAALEALPPHYRRVIELHELQGQPMETVARELQRSSGAAYMLRARALERMAELMGSASRYLSRAP